MREILFRAKREDNHEWVYGYFTKECPVYFGPVSVIETHEDDYKVIPETVCQFVNDHDIDGNKIFEFDIIECLDHSGNKRDCPNLVVTDNRGSFCCETGLGRWRPNGIECRVIGNAHDNPELLQRHGMRQFIFELGTCPDDYYERHQELRGKYKIHGAHAACYLENYESDYICHQYNGGCRRIDVCRKIYREEPEKVSLKHMEIEAGLAGEPKKIPYDEPAPTEYVDPIL